jgi:hypothetical protein
MNVDEYVELTQQLILKHIPPAAHSITAALLGNLLRRATPNVSWRDFQFGTLKDMLLEGCAAALTFNSAHLNLNQKGGKILRVAAHALSAIDVASVDPTPHAVHLRKWSF